MKTPEEFLSEKRSFDFLSLGKRSRVCAALDAYAKYYHEQQAEEKPQRSEVDNPHLGYKTHIGITVEESMKSTNQDNELEKIAERLRTERVNVPKTDKARKVFEDGASIPTPNQDKVREAAEKAVKDISYMLEWWNHNDGEERWQYFKRVKDELEKALNQNK